MPARRCQRVRFSIFLCFFLRMRLRRFLISEPMRGATLPAPSRPTPTGPGPNMPWGQGSTPLKDVLQTMKKNKYKFPNNIEFEYEGDPVTEVTKCLQLCKEMLA